MATWLLAAAIACNVIVTFRLVNRLSLAERSLAKLQLEKSNDKLLGARVRLLEAKEKRRERSE